MPNGKELDLSQGSVLHIKGFSTRGHPPKNKYCLVLGVEQHSSVLVFLISSQQKYREHPSFRDELVTVPKGAVHFLPQESFIQCFTLEKLDKEKLDDGYSRGLVDHKGKLGMKYLYKIRDAVKNSKLLTQQEVQSVLEILNLPKST